LCWLRSATQACVEKVRTGLKKALSARDFADAGALLPGSSRGGDFEIITKRKFRCCEAPWFYGIPVVSIENGLQFC